MCDHEPETRNRLAENLQARHTTLTARSIVQGRLQYGACPKKLGSSPRHRRRSVAGPDIQGIVKTSDTGLAYSELTGKSRRLPRGEYT